MATWLNTWLTPLWMLGLGALLGLLALLVLWGILWLVSRRAAASIPLAINEGVMLPIFWVTVAVAVLGLLGTFIVRDRTAIVSSLLRVPFTGTRVVPMTVPAADMDRDPVAVPLPATFRADELRVAKITCDSDLMVTATPNENGESPISWEVTGGEVFEWDRGLVRADPLAAQSQIQLFVTNLGLRATTAKFELMTAPTHPQASSIVVTALGVIVVFLVYLLLRACAPKMSAIALATAKSEMAQPLFLILTALGFFLIGLFLFIPYHTFGEDIKVLKDTGLTLIMVFAIFQAVWGASNSVSEEIEGKTALTVLSKPIGRRQFILGKFLGISWTSAVLFVLLGVWLLIIVAYKPIYDARETANTDPTWQECHIEMVRTVPGLVLAFMEAIVFAAISVAIATRLPLLANLIICFAIYAFGHLTPLLVQSGEGRLEMVNFMARFIATMLPVLDDFNVQAAIAAGAGVSYSYLGWMAVYCAIYCTVALLLALVLFEDRDLA